MTNSLDRYRYCNYCKYYKAVPGFLSRGYCSSPRPVLANRGYGLVFFESNACDDNFEMTIHNHFGLDYPEYLEEYKIAYRIKEALRWDMICLRNYEKAAREAKTLPEKTS